MATSTIPYIDADSGSLTPASGITAERARYNRSGRVVVVGLRFTLAAAISGTTDELFSGAPPAATAVRTFLSQANNPNGTNIRVEIDSSGKIRNAYTSGGIPAGQYEGEMVYICS